MGRRSAERPAATLILGYWLPAALYVGLIFLLSAQPHLKAPFSFHMADKVMHIAEYGGLGILLARAIAASGPRVAPITAGLLAMCLGITIGTADELFQAQVPGRESSAFDLAADTVGLGLAQLLVRMRLRG